MGDIDQVNTQVILGSSTTEESSVVPPALASYIATRDKRCLKANGWNGAEITQTFTELMKFGRVTVGGRATCGSSIDPSWVHFCAWKEVVKKARMFGYEINATPIPQKNAWATKAGGFWDEEEYVLVRTTP